MRIGRVGVQDRFGQEGSESYLREQYSLNAADVVSKVESILNV